MVKKKGVSFEDFKAQVTNLKGDSEFSFGFNWLDYVQNRLDEDIISTHKNDLIEIYNKAGIDIAGKSVFDIGCGSGLSSLCFDRLGAQSITSIDVDNYSVEATKFTKNKFSTNSNWNVKHHSILDKPAVPDQSIDMVYSWGVLHHTGDMWSAIRNAIRAVKPGGYLHVAFYISGNRYTEHLTDKFKFKFASREEKMEMLYNRKGILKHTWDYDNRGMNKFHDALDWLGGLPYEVCDPEVLHTYLKDKGFTKLLYFQKANQGGNFVSVLQRTQ